MYPKTFLFYRLLSQIGSVTLWSVWIHKLKAEVRLDFQGIFHQNICTMTVILHTKSKRLAKGASSSNV